MPILSIAIPVYFNEGNLFPMYDGLAKKVPGAIDASRGHPLYIVEQEGAPRRGAPPSQNEEAP